VTSRPPPTFLDVVTELGGGKFQELAGEILGEVIAACATNPGAKGKLTITIDVELKDGQLHMEPGFKTRKPYPPLPRSSWWVDDNNQLSLFDPNPDGPAVITFPPGGRGGGGGRRGGKGPAS
jgi:hypothetical protein